MWHVSFRSGVTVLDCELLYPYTLRYFMSVCCAQGVDIQAITDDIRKLKIIVKGHERRIKSLEEQLAIYETQQHAEYP